MKRLASVILLMLVMCVTMAQRPLIPAGSPGYMFTPSPSEPYVSISDPFSFRGGYWANRTDLSFLGDAHRSPSKQGGVTVYGVATVTGIGMLDNYPYLWVHLLVENIDDSVNHCYRQDTMASAFFCFMEQQPVSYADFRFVATWSSPFGGPIHDLPFYEFYFPTPVQVPAGARFFVGIQHSPYNYYNHLPEGPSGLPPMALYYDAPAFYSHNYPIPPEDGGGCRPDGLDSTWLLFRYRIGQGPVDWACDRCHNLVSSLGTTYKYCSFGFIPITRPPEDSSRIFPIHDHALRPGRVEGFRLTGLGQGHAAFAWDTLPPSDWGRAGVSVEAYEVSYAPYMQGYADGDTVSTPLDSCVLSAEFDTTVMYKARCRARGRHVCDIHNEVVFGEWSEEVYFHTGVGEPDTVPLECRRVEGLRHTRVLNGRPELEWERGVLHDRFEVQYAAVGGDGWHRDGITVQTQYSMRTALDSCVLYMVRVRGICDHHCHVHDTLMTGMWSDTVLFSIGPVGIGGGGEAPGGMLFTLAPNPARHTVAVRPALDGGECPAVLTVSDTKGREVARHTLADGSPLTLEVGALPAGAYLVTLTTRSRRTETQRLLVEP